jgi:hypothetical protein
MKNGSTTARGLLVIGFALALSASFGCGGNGGSGDGGTMAPAISCTDASSSAVNTVTLNCGGATDSATEKVDVMIAGPPTGSMTVQGFSFDVTYDPTKLEFVPAGTYTSPLFDPSALVLAVLANGEQGRVVVGIQQVGTLEDVAVSSGQHLVLSLSFRRVAGATFDPTPLMFDRADATYASATVTFEDGLALGYPQ